jgi:O-antigen ligase
LTGICCSCNPGYTRVVYRQENARFPTNLAVTPANLLRRPVALVGNLSSRISWYICGNYTLSGRTLIWDFVNFEIAKRPLLGWGYRSFWLVGPDSPNIVDGSGWVRFGNMPSAHNGYLDTILDTGHIGLVLFLVFIFTTLHAIGRVADRDPARAWILLSIALFIFYYPCKFP